MEIIVIGLLAFVGYKLFRHISGAGKEAVRAYVYLQTLHKGLSAQEANAVTDAMLSDIGSEMASRATAMARDEYRQVHNSRQLAVVGFAYRNGMRSRMPFWYTALARSAPPTMEVEVNYGRLKPEVMPGAENLQRLTGMVTDDGYKLFCATFCHEVNRLAGEDHFEEKAGSEVNDEVVYQRFQQGHDPLVTAAMYCHENGLNHETFATYESYRSAFANELLRLASSRYEFDDWLSKVDNTKVHSSFVTGAHPRLAAMGYHQIISQPQGA